MSLKFLVDIPVSGCGELDKFVKFSGVQLLQRNSQYRLLHLEPLGLKLEIKLRCGRIQSKGS